MWVDIDQNTDEWLDLRAGKVTGSSIGKVMANYGKAFGDPAKKLAAKLALERVTGKRVEENNFTNSHMERGHEQEPIARRKYEEREFVEVLNGGFFDNNKTGSSPDGRVSPDGIIEIKCVIYHVHLSVIKRNSYDPKYKWQYFFNIREAGADWLDFISYCSDFPKHNDLAVFRVEKKDISKELEMIESRLEQFEKLISQESEIIMENAA